MSIPEQTKAQLLAENEALREALKRETAVRQTSDRVLADSLEQQMATSEILRVISQSRTDVQPVLDAVAENATRLCGATDAIICGVADGLLYRVAHFGPLPLVPDDVRAVTPDTPTGRAVIERRVLHVHDILEEFERGEYAAVREIQRSVGFRTV